MNTTLPYLIHECSWNTRFFLFVDASQRYLIHECSWNTRFFLFVDASQRWAYHRNDGPSWLIDPSVLDLQRLFQESIGFTDGRVSIKNDMFKACCLLLYGLGVPGGNSCLMRLIAGVWFSNDLSSRICTGWSSIRFGQYHVLLSFKMLRHLGPTLGVSCGKVLESMSNQFLKYEEWLSYFHSNIRQKRPWKNGDGSTNLK